MYIHVVGLMACLFVEGRHGIMVAPSTSGYWVGWWSDCAPSCCSLWWEAAVRSHLDGWWSLVVAAV